MATRTRRRGPPYRLGQENHGGRISRARRTGGCKFARRVLYLRESIHQVMSIKRLLKGAVLRVPPVRRYVAAENGRCQLRWSRLKLSEASCCGRLQQANSIADMLRATVNEVTEQAAALSEQNDYRM